MDTNFQDKTIECRDCRAAFTFTAGEQDFFSQKGFNPPTRCKTCRQQRKMEKEGGGGATAQGNGNVPQPQFTRPVVQEAPQPPRGGGRPKSKQRGGGGGRNRYDNYD